ncbi:hypothetical protein [Helicobacter cholecystus]|uniref:hypothetical protein n=1 Tax=Helicobacter cholecystus TaxID=45498 RepID=UPI00273929C4|nr:hypothetical protein [Helicobacter cholecystus]
MHARKGFMLLEALVSLLIFTLIVSLSFFLISLKKPSVFSPTLAQQRQIHTLKTQQLQSGEIKLKFKIGEWYLKNERYLLIQDVL